MSPRPTILLAVLIPLGLLPATRLSAQSDPASTGPWEAPEFLLSVGRIVEHERGAEAATILGAERELAIPDQSLTLADRVFVPVVLNGRRLEADDTVQFFRLARRVEDPVTRQALGWLEVPTGVGRVDSLAGDVARVRITLAYLPILVDDAVRAVTAADTSSAESALASGSTGGHVVTFQAEKAIHPPYDILFLTLPAPFALAPGTVVVLYRPGPIVKGDRLPDIDLGRAVVVDSDERFAAAVLTESVRSDLEAGDRYRLEEPPAR